MANQHNVNTEILTTTLTMAMESNLFPPHTGRDEKK